MSQQLEIDRSELGHTDFLATGGQAKLYRVPDLALPGVPGPLVYKQYLPKVLQGRALAIRHSLTSMIRIRTSANPTDRAHLDSGSTWPLAVVADEYGATGFVMREIPADYRVELVLSTGRRIVEPCEAVQYLQPESSVVARGLVPLSVEGRMYLLLRVMDFVRLQHRLDVVIGDFSASNFVVHVDAVDQRMRNRAMFLDVDSYRVHSGVSAIPQPQTPEWETPEYLTSLRRYRQLKTDGGNSNAIAQARAATRYQDKASDVFKVGLLIMRLFDDSDEVTLVRDSAAARQSLRHLLGERRSLQIWSAMADNPRDRPTIAELRNAFVGS